MRVFMAVFLMMWLPIQVCHAQVHPSIQKFEIFTVSGKVALRWTMKPGNTCLGTGILRSADDVSFDQIGIIGGVCGSPDNPVTYTFIDSFPLTDRTAYYKLVLGLLGETMAIPYRYIDFTRQKALVYPNPFNNMATVVFAQEPVDEVLVSLYAADGQLLYTETFRQTNEFSIFGQKWLNEKPGTIFFSVTAPDGKIISSGSFVYTNK